MITYESFKNGLISFGVKYNEFLDAEGITVAFPGAQTKDYRMVLLTFFFHNSGAIVIGNNVTLKIIPRNMNELLGIMNNVEGSTCRYSLKGDSFSTVQPVAVEEWMQPPDLVALAVNMAESTSELVEAIENGAKF